MSQNPYADLVEKNPYSDMVASDAPPSALDRAGRVVGLGARALVKGVSAVPTMMADVVATPLRAMTGGRYFPPPSAVLDQKLSQAGLPSPETPVERISSDVTGALAGMGGQLGLMQSLAGSGGVLGGVAQQMAQSPGKQLIAAATGPGAASVTREAGGGPGAQFAAGVAGSMLPFAGPISRGGRPLTPTEQVAVESRDAGYVIPPTQVRPNVINRALEGTAGKITTAQQASSQNQVVTNRLAAESLGLPPETTITPKVLDDIRAQAGTAYNRIKMLPLKFKTDQQFAQDVGALGNDFATAAKEFPEIAGNKLIEELQQGLNKPTVSPVAAIELIKKLRFDASKNFKAVDDPAKAALASAQKQAANAVEDLVERRLGQSGKGDLVQAFKDARTLIAKTYDVDAALNDTTSTISARVLGNQMNRGAPMTGQLATAARFSNAFPRAAQTPEGMGSIPGWSPLDAANAGIMSALGASAAQSPYGAAAGLVPLARPLIRSGILSAPYQNAITPSPSVSRETAIIQGLLANLYQPK